MNITREEAEKHIARITAYLIAGGGDSVLAQNVLAFWLTVLEDIKQEAALSHRMQDIISKADTTTACALSPRCQIGGLLGHELTLYILSEEYDEERRKTLGT